MIRDKKTTKKKSSLRGIKRRPVSRIKKASTPTVNKRSVASPTTTQVKKNSTTNITKDDVKKKMDSMKNNPKYKGVVKRGLGGLIGTGAGAIGGAFLGNPMMGAKIGGMLGGGVDTMMDAKKQKEALEQDAIANKTRGTGSMGYRKGGKLKSYKKGGEPDPKLPSKMKSKDRLGKHSPHSIARDLTTGFNFSARARRDELADSSSDHVNRLKTASNTAYGWGKAKQDHNEEVDAIEKKAGKLLPKMIDDQRNTNLNNIKKIGTKDFADGGSIEAIGQDAVKFKGPSHEQGGIDIPEANAEVEGEETMDNIEGSDYVFSKELKVPGTDKSFAQVHEQLVKADASEEEIAALADVQEKVSGRDKKKFGGALRKYRRK